MAITIYSMHHQQTIEDFVLRWGAVIPKDSRQLFVAQLTEIVKLTGEEAVASFVEGLKNYMTRT